MSRDRINGHQEEIKVFSLEQSTDFAEINGQEYPCKI
jgi:hypothetical protein